MPPMPMRFLAFAAVIALGATIALAQDAPVVDPAIAAMSVDQLAEARQAAMKEDAMLPSESGGATAERRDEIATRFCRTSPTSPPCAGKARSTTSRTRCP